MYLFLFTTYISQPYGDVHWTACPGYFIVCQCCAGAIMSQPSPLCHLSHCHLSPWAHVTLPPLFSNSQSTKSALILYTVLLSEIGSIYEEEKDFSVERTGLVSSSTHTIKMSRTYILLKSLWNLQNWTHNTELITTRQHMKLGDNIFQTILAWKARLSACLALNSWKWISTWCYCSSPPASGGGHGQGSELPPIEGRGRKGFHGIRDRLIGMKSTPASG